MKIKALALLQIYNNKYSVFTKVYALHQHQKSGLQIFVGADAGQWPIGGLSCRVQQWQNSNHEVQTAHPTQGRYGLCSTQGTSTSEGSTVALQEDKPVTHCVTTME
jgi:hypothetical protein